MKKNKQEAEMEPTREVIHIKKEVLWWERAQDKSLRHWNITWVATASWAWGRRAGSEREGTVWGQITKSFGIHHKELEIYFRLFERLLKGFSHGNNIIWCVFWKIIFAIK